MSCSTLKAYTRICGKNAKTGVNPDVYLIAFDDLANIDGSTEVFTESVTGLVNAINIKTPSTTVFVKWGTVLNQGSIKEDFTANDNGTYDIAKAVAFALNAIGTVEGRAAAESLIGEAVVPLIKLNSGVWIVAGLNGQMQLKTSAGTVDASSNGRVLTLSGSDSVLFQTVDPTIIASLITLDVG